LPKLFGLAPVDIVFIIIHTQYKKPESGGAAFRRKKTAVGDFIAFWPGPSPAFFAPAEAEPLLQVVLYWH
jgi:hypothetical protein